MNLHVFILTLASVLATSAPGFAQAATDPTGKWDVSINTGQEIVPAILTLEKKADKFTGGIRDGRAPDRGEAPVEATVTEKKITISFDYNDTSGPMHIVMDGTIENNSMGGSVRFGDAGSGEWTAKRSTAAATSDKPAEKAPGTSAGSASTSSATVDVTGTWAASVATSTINASPTLVLKQDGEKISGQYVSAQYGSFPLQGTVKGNALNLNVQMTIEGNALAVAIAGTVDKDTITGTVNYQGIAEGTFSAKKK